MSQPIHDYQFAPDGHVTQPLRALVVEDSTLQRRVLSASLRKWGFEVHEADSGRAALEICQNFPPDVVVSDWMMPEMNGLDFCREFRAMPRDSYGYFILLTSKSDKGEVALGLDCGADDFVTKPVNQSELRARISAGERILGMERQLQKQNKIIGETLTELTELHDAMDRDLRQARNIQQSVLPARETIIQGTRISTGLRSCGHVGGDFVGLFQAGNNQVGLYNIDVSGHGITSALMTARISGYLSDRYPDHNVALKREGGGRHAIREPAETAEILNERLLVDAGVDQYFTMAFAAFDLGTGRARITQAGHPSPILITTRGDIQLLGQGGFPIGLLPDVGYDQFEVTLNQGDRLLFCSDGLTEAVLKSGKEVSDDGLAEIIHENLTKTGRSFLDGLYISLLSSLPKGGSLDDDISAIMVEYLSGQP